VGQFNDGLNLIDAEDEKIEVTTLNLRVVKKPKMRQLVDLLLQT
jgi:hypothetical protein